MQLASQNPFSGLICFCKVYWPTPFSMHFDFRPLFRITFAELSQKHPYSQTPAISRGCTEGKAKTRGLGVIWLLQSLTFGNLATTTRILWCPSPAGPRAAVGGSPLHIMINIMSQNTWRHDCICSLIRCEMSMSATLDSVVVLQRSHPAIPHTKRGQPRKRSYRYPAFGRRGDATDRQMLRGRLMGPRLQGVCNNYASIFCDL